MDFERDEKGLCVFCHGDPCAESSKEDSDIVQYFKLSPWAETCPVCRGLPS